MLSGKIDQVFLDTARRLQDEREQRMADPGTAANPAAYRNLLKSHARLKKIADMAEALLKMLRNQADNLQLSQDKNAEPELVEMARAELQEQETALPELERRLLMELAPPSPADHRNTIIEIRAGAGGQEASIFVGDLLRMYTRYGENQGWQVEMIDGNPSETGGYKEVVFSLQGENVYRELQYEAGTHRVQRVPVTEACGRIHTSTVTVAVLPEADDVDDIEIKPEDLKIDVYRASGAGGQHVNKTDSAVRITHMPTGLVAASQEERSQHKNRARAMRVLRSHLLAIEQARNFKQIGDERRAQIGTGERSERIRTYNFPQNRLTDHRINFTIYSLNRVMEGELNGVIQALREYNLEQRLKAGTDLNRLLAEFDHE